MKKFNLVFAILAFLSIVSFVLTACGLSAPVPPAGTISKFTAEMKAAYQDAAAVYSAHVDLDAQETMQVKNYTALYEAMRSEVKDELAIMDLCYSNTQTFFIAAITAAFGDKGLGGAEDKALLSMLSTRETYPGDITKCQEAATNVAIYTRSKRDALLNIKAEIFRIQAEISKLELGDLKTAVIIDFFNKYGGDMQTLMQSGDSAFATFVGSQSENHKLPARFFGFPTQALQAESRDMKICNGYQGIYDGTTPPPSGKQPYQYQVSIDSVAGICTLYQAAAEGYIAMITVPSQAAMNNLQEGCTSVVPGGCDESQP